MTTETTQIATDERPILDEDDGLGNQEERQTDPKQSAEADSEDIKTEVISDINMPGNINNLDRSDSVDIDEKIPYDPHNNETHPINVSEDTNPSNVSGLESFFSSQDYAPPIPFNWTIYQKIRLTAPNIVSLIRSSCKTITENSKYIDINYSYLAEYAKKWGTLSYNPTDLKPMTSERRFLNLIEESVVPERDIINLLCLFITLTFGSGFYNRKDIGKDKDEYKTISKGIQKIYKKYGSLDTKTLENISWTIEYIAELFEINYEDSLPLKSLCDMIRKCIEEIIHILSLKDFSDFADYVYYHIDLAWIKSQTKDLSALEDVEWILDEDGKLGLELAPTKSNQVRRCVVVGFNDNNTNLSMEALNRLVEKRAFIYAINDQVVYNSEFDAIIQKIKDVCDISTEPNYYAQPDDVTSQRFIRIQFGLYLDSEPNTVQALLFNLINDFPCLNDQYLYKNVFGNKKNLRVYLFQKVQLIVSELYTHLYKKKGVRVFNFKDINSLLPLYNNIPFVLLKDNVIKIKDEFKEEFDEQIQEEKILKSCDLEVEMRASALWAIELLSNYDVPGLVSYLWNKGECNEYKKYQRHYVRDTVYY